MTEIANVLPWVTLLVVFIVMGLLQWRVITALDHALLRSQQDPLPAPLAPPRLLPPRPPAIATPAPIALPPALPRPPSGPFVGAPPWFNWAMGEVGTREEAGNTGPALARYAQLAHCGSPGDAWCAIFANAALESSGLSGTRSASSQSFRSHPQFVKLDGPALGAIVVFWRGTPDSGLGHVGFYRGEYGAHVWTLGGNEDDMVQIDALPVSGASFGLVGYYWPKSVPLPRTGAVAMPAGSATSIKTPQPVGATAAPAGEAAAINRNITATYFGGPRSAYDGGKAIDDSVAGVALPLRFEGPRPRVRVTNVKTGASVDCDIVDVGPWNTHDPYWQTGARPQAESGVDNTGRRTNGAGIDLTLAAAKAIQIDGKGLVDWCFLSSPATPKVI